MIFWEKHLNRFAAYSYTHYKEFFRGCYLSYKMEESERAIRDKIKQLVEELYHLKFENNE